MKTRAFLIVVLLSVLPRVGVQAQYSDYYYHRVGDTIEWKSEIGYYDWWEFEQWYQLNLGLGIQNWVPTISTSGGGTAPLFGFDSAVMLQRFYTPVPLKIIGMATSSVRGHGSFSPRGYSPDRLDTDSFKQYLYIYNATPDSFPLVASVEWSPLDPCRYLYVKGHTSRSAQSPPDTCCFDFPAGWILPLYEYYFDTAIYVVDSFYVGGSDFSAYDAQETDPLSTVYWAASPLFMHHACDSRLQVATGPTQCLIPDIHIKVKYGQRGYFHQAQWQWAENAMGQSVMTYPIVEVDTTVPPRSACDTITNIQVTTAGLSATVTWDDFPNYTRVLLRYGRHNEPQSEWREEDVTGNTLYTLTGLAPVSFYGVSLKAECDGCKKETPWSEPFYFYVGTDTTSGGIEAGGSALSRLTFLRPNPAQDEVQVTSSFNLLAVEIWTVDGVMVHHQPVSGHEARVDVGWLRAGTYIVAVHTHGGTTHKRLIIVR